MLSSVIHTAITILWNFDMHSSSHLFILLHTHLMPSYSITYIIYLTLAQQSASVHSVHVCWKVPICYKGLPQLHASMNRSHPYSAGVVLLLPGQLIPTLLYLLISLPYYSYRMSQRACKCALTGPSCCNGMHQNVRKQAMCSSWLSHE